MERNTTQRNQNAQNTTTTTIIKTFPPPPPPPAAKESSETPNRMPMVFDAATNRRVRPTNATDSKYPSANKTGSGVDRERMKDMVAESFSRHETISILPGFKEEGRPGKPCIKVSSSASNSQQQQQQFTSSEKPPTGNVQWKHAQVENDKSTSGQGQVGQNTRGNGGVKHGEAVRNHESSPAPPWPYSQKSQQSIREAQAAYRRDLEKQIEEKRLCKDKNIRKCVSSSAAASEPANSKPVNQSVSLEEFRNTGFLPPWFDPIKNNPLYKQQEQAHQHQSEGFDNHDPQHPREVPPPPQPQPVITNVYMNHPKNLHPEQLGPPPPQHPGNPVHHYPPPPPQHAEQLPCDYYMVPKEVIDQMNRNNGCYPMQMDMSMYQPQHQTFYGPPPDMQHNQRLPPGMIHIESSYHSGPGIPPPPPQQQQMVHYVQAPQQMPQQRQVLQPMPHPSVSIFPFVQNNDSQQQHPELEDHHDLPHHQQMYQQVRCHPDQLPHGPNEILYAQQTESQQYTINLRNLPPPPTPPCHQDPGLHLAKFSNRNPCKMLENIAEPLQQPHPEQMEPPPGGFGGPAEEGEQVEEGNQVSREGEDGNEDAARAMYKAELAKQIEEKRRKHQELVAREEEENAKYERKIQEDQRRMMEEYEEEQRKQKLKHEEFVRRQEAFMKERERYEKQLQQDRLRNNGAPHRIQQPTPRHCDGDHEEPVGSTPRLKVSESTHDEVYGAAAAHRRMMDEHQNHGSPRPRTVVICHSVSAANASEGVRCKDAGRQGGDVIADDAGAGDAKVMHRDDIQFLSNLKKAILAEDERMTRILNKKRPLILASHYMS